MNNHRFSFPVLILGLALLVSCSTGNSPVAPNTPSPGLKSNNAASQPASKALWGYWDVSIDTATWEATAIPVRGAEYTVDVVSFLQKPAGNPANLSIKVTDTSGWLTDGLITVDVGLKHPFPGLDQYTGFDVMGQFVTPGNLVGEYDTDVILSDGDSAPILLNADGYSRWMNPVEFIPNGTILRFVPGKLGNQDTALFTSTINGYKYFADNLGKSESVADFLSNSANTQNRGLFSSGVLNTREYKLKFAMSGGAPILLFQYAVVASWVEPDMTLSGDPGVIDVPGDFPLSANASEAICLNVTDDSTLYYNGGAGGGKLDLKLEVFDWGALKPGGNVQSEIHAIALDTLAPDGYPAPIINLASGLTASAGSSTVSSVFEVESSDWTPISDQDITVLITVESESPDKFDPGTGTPANYDRLAAYFLHTVHVGSSSPEMIQLTSPNGGENWMVGEHKNITWTTTGYVGNIKLEYSKDGFAADVHEITPSAPDTGIFDWIVPDDPSNTVKVRATLAGAPSIFDDSDANFTISLVSDLTLDVIRSTYSPGYATNPQTYIDYLHLDWSDIAGAAEYAVYRADLWTLPYAWTEIATTVPATTQYDNIRTGANAFNWDMDYIYEVRARSTAGNPSSEFATSQRALIVMESNDNTPGDTAPWQFKKGTQGINGQWGGNWNADDTDIFNVAMYFWWIDQIPNAWEIALCPQSIPDIAGQSTAYCDFAFTNGPGYTIPLETGWAPGTMTQIPVTGVDTCFDFDPTPSSEFKLGTTYNPSFVENTFTQRFGEASGAFTTDYYPFKGTRYGIPKLLEDTVDYAGIGVAAYNSNITNSWGYLCLDSIAVVVY
jgi:hypothetical protein